MKNTIKNYMVGLLRILRQVKQGNSHPADVPNTLFSDDVFIVSYPKSGNTWVRFLIANLIKQPEDEIDFHSVHDYIPAVVRHDERIAKLPRPRVIKSHATYRSEYPKVIYLVRDGRDVYTSYYFYRQKKLPPGTTFNEYLKRNNHKPCLWGTHITSWLFVKFARPEILTVKYEDLMTNTLKELQRMATFIGLNPTEKQLQIAVQASSFENMQRLERERGRLYSPTGVKTFVRKGEPGNWKEYFGPEAKAVFKSREGDVLIKLGYEADHDW